MPQGALPFQYAEENTSTGMTALSGLPAYVDMAEVSQIHHLIGDAVEFRS